MQGGPGARASSKVLRDTHVGDNLGCSSLNRELGLGTSAPAVRTVGVARELEELRGLQLQHLLEAAADGEQDIASLICGSALAAGDVTVTAARDALANGAGPDTHTEEGLSDVDNHAHDLSILFLLQSLADGGQHGVKPQLVDIDAALILEAVRPLSAVLVLGVLPFWPDTLFKEVVVGLECKAGNGGNIILGWTRVRT